MAKSSPEEQTLTPPEQLQRDWRVFRSALFWLGRLAQRPFSMQIWRELFSKEIFRWEFIGVAFTLFFGTGWAMLGLEATYGFQVLTYAEICFAAAAIILLVKFAHIAITGVYPWWERWIFTALLFSAIGVGAVELFRWIERHRPPVIVSEQQKQRVSEISNTASPSPSVPVSPTPMKLRSNKSSPHNETEDILHGRKKGPTIK